MLKKLFTYITPFTILATAIIVMLVRLPDDKGGDLSAMVTVGAMMILLPAILIDIVLRVFLHKKYHWVWLIEGLVFFIFCFMFLRR